MKISAGKDNLIKSNKIPSWSTVGGSLGYLTHRISATQDKQNLRFLYDYNGKGQKEVDLSCNKRNPCVCTPHTKLQKISQITSTIFLYTSALARSQGFPWPSGLPRSATATCWHWSISATERTLGLPGKQSSLSNKRGYNLLTRRQLNKCCILQVSESHAS